MRSVEVDPAVHNGSSKSTFTSFIAEEEEKREENPSNPVVLARPTQFMSSMVSDKLSDKWAMKDGSAQTVGPAGDVWTGAHDNERHDTISSDISRTSGVTSGRLSDAFVENQISGHRPCKSRLCTPPHHQSQIDFVVPGKRRASQPLPESYNGTPNKVAKAATFACATDSLAEEDEIPYNGTVSCLTPVKLATPPTPVTVMRQLRLACNEKKTNESAQRTNESSRNPVCLLSPTHSCHMNSTASHLRTTAKNVFGEAHFLSEQVEKKLALCTCCNRLHIQRLEEGRYKVNGRIYYFRRFRNHVMVRIGGGWLTLDVFLSRHDPCRRGKCVPAAVPDSRIALSSSVSDLQKTDFDSKKSLISMTTSVMALSRESSARSTSSDQSQSEVNEVVNTESSQPLNSSHPNLFIGAPSTNPKSLSLSTSRLPVPVRSSHGQSDISEGTGPTDNYYKIIPRAPSHSSIYRGSINSAARHSRESSQRRLSESSSSRVLSTTTVNSPSLRILSHVAHSSQGSATKPNLPQAPTRIPVPRKSVSRVSGSTQNSGPSIPSLTHSLLPTKTYHDEHQ
ncbi:Growth-Arrest-Specific Protein 2 domain protein [Opisthorchis viverrini]|uniref:Growth-Arrest-Specific Protein 2 domain protein n=1 Tax=Opisthorchis viverrini TaxID=6198 RepID=A0A1S8WH10_OPIVI|nr:Growth-Arrest-Specific Protein 2 domain protein [Opisthorchis viverrini]